MVTKIQIYSGAVRTSIPVVIAKLLNVTAGDSIEYVIKKNGAIVIKKANQD